MLFKQHLFYDLSKNHHPQIYILSTTFWKYCRQLYASTYNRIHKIDSNKMWLEVDMN